MKRVMATTKFADLSGVILLMKRSLETDGLIERLVSENGGKNVLPRWRGNKLDAVACSRRILKTAMLWGDPQTQFRQVQQKESFERLAKSADKTGEAIDGFLSALGEGQQLSPEELQCALEIHARLAAGSRGEATEGNEAEFRKTARNQCEALKEVRELVKVIGNESARRRTEIASRTHNIGKPEKRYFVHVLMEGWMFLTGKKPSHANTRFLEFVRAAWQIACPTANDTVDWVQAVRGAARMRFAGGVERIAGLFPDWNLRVDMDEPPSEVSGGLSTSKGRIRCS